MLWRAGLSQRPNKFNSNFAMNNSITDKRKKAYPLAVERRRRYLFKRFQLTGKRVLELGALDMPTFENYEADIDYMDYYSDDEFKEMASKGGLSRPLETLVSVKHVVKEKHFANRINDRYDLIIAAHVIEHIPDPLSWLAELSDLLTPRGFIFLAIPDRRYTLDYLRRETTPVDLIRNFKNNTKLPDIYSIADFYFYKRNINGREVWQNPEIISEKINEPSPTLLEALAKAERSLISGSEHANVHCNVFSYSSFAELWKAIAQTGVVDLELDLLADVQRDGNEFWAFLRKRQVVSAKDRRPVKGRKFLEGKDGILFLDNDTNNTIAQITGRAPLSPADLGRWERLIRSRHLLLKDEGIPYAFVIAPAKEAALDKYLPDGIALSNNRPAIQLLNTSPRLEGVIKYPIDALRILEREGYGKGDSHWSDLGGLMVFRLVMTDFVNQLGIRLPELSDYEVTYEERLGDLAVHARQRNTEQIVCLKSKTNSWKVVLDNRQPNRGNMIVTENPTISTGTIVVFRDSFTSVMIQYFATTFSKCVFIWNPFVDYDLIEKYKPVLVLNIMAERFLTFVPDDVNKFSWEQIELMKRSLG